MSLSDEIRAAINGCSRENESNTPDFILAEYLMACLVAFESASRRREKWYGQHLSIGGNARQLEVPPANGEQQANTAICPECNGHPYRNGIGGELETCGLCHGTGKQQ